MLAPALFACLLLLRPSTAARQPGPPLPAVEIRLPSDLLDVPLPDAARFRRSVAAARPYEIDPPLLGIVPHHDVAGELAASFFLTAAGRPVDTVILLGPNHSGRGAELAITHKGYSTPLGDLTCDRDAALRLQKVPGLLPQDELMRREHSVSALLQLVRHTFPQAQVVTLLLANTAPGDCLSALAAELAELTREKSCFIVGSIDFSHGLQPQQAQERDAETAALIESGDLSALAQLGNEHLDAPAVLTVMLRLAQHCGRELTLMERADASAFVPPPWPDGVTSYLLYAG